MTLTPVPARIAPSVSLGIVPSHRPRAVISSQSYTSLEVTSVLVSLGPTWGIMPCGSARLCAPLDKLARTVHLRPARAGMPMFTE